MPSPHASTSARSLRLSHPRLFSALVADMKATRGSRDWRSFEVFPEGDGDEMEVDDGVAERCATERTRRWEKKMEMERRRMEREANKRREVDGVDLIG